MGPGVFGTWYSIGKARDTLCGRGVRLFFFLSLYIFDCCYTLTSDHGWNYELLVATEVIHTTEAERRDGPNSDGEPATVVQIYALLMREAYQGLGGTFTVAPIHRQNSDRTFAVTLQRLHTSSEIAEFRLHELLASAPKALIQASPNNQALELRSSNGGSF